MEFRLDAYCGLYCGACPAMLAHQNGELEALAESIGMEPEDARCLGCKSEKVASFCASCKIRQCASDKGFDFCFRCEELPCAPFVAFRDDERYPYHAAVPKNLARVQEVGAATWLEEQRVRWRCPACGAQFAWQDETCKNCGQPVSNYKADLGSEGE
jgi:predicted RNA-binding Zn-ribbon protein involved in translation (DUF1610 family)